MEATIIGTTFFFLNQSFHPDPKGRAMRPQKKKEERAVVVPAAANQSGIKWIGQRRQRRPASGVDQ
jgi:hypothetical protein